MTPASTPDGRAATRLLGQWVRAKRASIHATDITPAPTIRARSEAVTQWQAARRADLGMRTWRAVENGYRAPGPKALDGIARALNLNHVEETYLRRLAHAAHHNHIHHPDTVPAPLRRAAVSIVDGHHRPGYAVDHHWNVIAANPATTRTAPGITVGRNLLDWFFTNPHAQQLLPDWEQHATHIVGTVRTQQADRPADPWYETTMTRLARPLWHQLLLLTQPEPTTTIRVRCAATGDPTELTATRLQLQGSNYPGLQIVLLH